MNIKKIFKLSFLSAISFGLLGGALTIAHNFENVEVVSAWSLDVKPSVDCTYYSACDGKTGANLKSALANINKPVSKSYNWSRYEAADEAYDDSTSILCIYTRHNIKKSSHCGNYSWDKWNREHVYTQSAFPNSDDDNHNIFACEGQINNYRGNLKFAEVTHNSSTQLTVFGHLTNCYREGDYFEPCDEAKGEIARACLYCTVYYGYTLPQIFDSMDTALKWNAEFQVSPREIYRNNIVHGLQGNRNPFVDHPSYAKSIYGGPEYGWDDPVSDGPYVPVAVTGVSLDNTTLTIEKGETSTLVATVSPSNATNKNVTWSSENPLVATVTNGAVKGIDEGTTTISVKTEDGNFVASCQVTVENTSPSVPVTGVSLNLDSITMKPGQAKQLVAAINPENATNKKVVWSVIPDDSSFNPITVDQNGFVTAIEVGSAKVVVTTDDGGFTATCNVIVKEEKPKPSGCVVM